LAVVLSLALPLSPILASAQADVTDAEVRKGIRAVDEGDYDAAIFTLDAAARRLAADSSGARDLPQAYLYLGIAYVGKGHEAAAKAKFREALRQIKDLSLNADRYPPKVIDVFEAAKAENERDASANTSRACARREERGRGKDLAHRRRHRGSRRRRRAGGRWRRQQERKQHFERSQDHGVSERGRGLRRWP
jgi:tetratricopeptide (TPR) repeat protein